MMSTRTLIVVVLAGWIATVAAAVQIGRRQQPPEVAGAAPAATIGSIKELMDGVIDPTADVLFDAVSYDITAAGTTETKPTTDQDWAEVRRHALILAEAATLLKAPGRRVVPERPINELEADLVGPDDLTPDQIQALIDETPDRFARLADDLTAAARVALDAADARSVDALFESGGAIYKACDACHDIYWFPKDRQPALDALAKRKK